MPHGFPRPPSRGLRPAAAVVILALAAACESPTGPSAPERPDVRSFVTSEVARQLDGNGNFRMPVPRAPGSMAILTPEEAVDLGSAFIRSFLNNPDLVVAFGQDPRAVMESEHGGSIDWSKLEVSEEPYFARGYLEVLPDSLPNYVHNWWGPWYLMPLLDRGEEVGLLGLAAYATDLYVGEDGGVRMPPVGGNWFRTQGVPMELTEGVPTTPEAAVRYVAQTLGTRIAAVPTMERAPVLWVPMAARWRVELENAVKVRHAVDGTVEETKVVYVGHYPALADGTADAGPLELRMFVALPDQPRWAEIRYSPPDDHADRRTFEWPILEGHPTTFARVEPAGG